MKGTHWQKVRHSDMLRCRLLSCTTSPIPIGQCYASLISCGFTQPVLDATQGSTGRASGTQSLIAQTFNLPVPTCRTFAVSDAKLKDGLADNYLNNEKLGSDGGYSPEIGQLPSLGMIDFESMFKMMIRIRDRINAKE